MNKILHCTALFVLLFTSYNQLLAQQGVGIGTSTPNQHAVLDVVSSSNNKGILIPRLTTAQRNAMSGSLASTEVGLMVFDVDINGFYYWDGIAWASIVLAQNISINGNTVGIDGGGSGFNLSPIAPISGQVLKWNGSAWEAAIDDTATGGVLPVLGNAQIVTNNGVNLAVSVSGDITMNNGGVITIQPNVIDSTNITNNSVISADIRDGTITSADIIGNGVTSFNILNNTLANIDVSTTAAILGTKISPNFGTQNILTTGDIGVGVAAPLATLDVRGNQIVGTGLAPTAATADNILNLQVGNNIDGATNGISFFELTGGFGMKLGYDGSGSGANNKLAIYNSDDAEVIVFENGGNLGLGVANPTQRLEVLGNTVVTGNSTVNGNITVAPANELFVNRISSVDNTANFMGWDVGGTGVFRIHTGANSVIYAETDGRVRIGTQGNPSNSAKLLVQGAGFGTNISLLTRNSLGTQRFVVLDNGNVGINRTPTTNALEVNGNASKTTTGGWLIISDRRVKTDIRDIENSTDIIKKLRPVKFKYTEYWKARNPSIKDYYYYNFIAQEYREVFPDAVKGSGEYIEGDSEEIIQIDTYDAQITGLKALQELIYRVEALERENGLLKKGIATINASENNAEIIQLKNDNIEIRLEYENLKTQLLEIQKILSITGSK
ncbi:MAG: tail fiber domain-containing protein [Cyclobacteriaceae bacterium]|nr:tail fiber domain-containing protein [Cyclobacteriaceae bacterium]